MYSLTHCICIYIHTLLVLFDLVSGFHFEQSIPQVEQLSNADIANIKTS